MKYRNTREEREKRKRRRVPRRLFPGPPVVTDFIRTQEVRLAEQRTAAQNLQGLPRPLKPPKRKETEP